MSEWLPSLNALRAFEVVSRHLNYRHAADELRVTPAAVKQLVAKLEDALGEPLVERRGRGLVLTAAGASGSDDLTAAFRQVARAVERMRERSRGTRLIVSVDPSFAAAWLVPRLEDFKTDSPGVEVLIDSSPQIVDVAGGAADIAIRFGVREHHGLVAYRLFDEELCTFCSPSLAKGPPGLRRVEDLGRVTLLRWDLSQFDWASNTRRWNYWRHWLAQFGADHVKPTDGPRFSDYNLAVQAAIAGQGVIIGSRPVLRRLVEAGLLVNPLGECVSTDVGYDLVTTEHALARDEVTRFIQWILQEASTETAGAT